MNRRELIALLGGTVVSWPIATGAGEAVVEPPITRALTNPYHRLAIQ
jgi:hypothetical protein